MNTIDRLQAFYNAAAYIESNEAKSRLAIELGLDPSSIEPRLEGLRAQDEFLLILHYLQSCKHLLAFDESASVLSQSYQPDLFVQTNTGERMLVEVKSTTAARFEISGGNLQKRIQFAKNIGFPLFFAVRINGIWLLVKSKYLQENSGKLKLDTDYQNSEFASYFESTLYAIPQGIKVISQYSLNDKSTDFIQHGEYGGLISYKFYFQDKLIFSADKTDYSAIGHSMVLERLHDEMANTHMKIEDGKDGLTTTTEMLDYNMLIPDYAFYLSSVFHTLRNAQDAYDVTTLFKDLLESKKPFVNPRNLHATKEFLVKRGVPIKATTTIPKDVLFGQHATEHNTHRNSLE